MAAANTKHTNMQKTRKKEKTYMQRINVKKKKRKETQLITS